MQTATYRRKSYPPLEKVFINCNEILNVKLRFITKLNVKKAT